MSIIGVVAGPEQIADGTVPSQLAKVDEFGNESVLEHGEDQAGRKRRIRTAPDGSQQLASDGILAAILIELQILNKNIVALGAGQIVTDDPDLDRLDADRNDRLDPYNLTY